MINNSTIEVVDFGYDKLNAYLNMAIDESLLNYVVEKTITNKLIVRTYDFSNPSIILGRNDDISNIKRLDNQGIYDITRRETGGMPIYVGDETYAYSIIGNLSFLKNDIITIELHKLLGPAIMNMIKELIPENKKADFKVGDKYSIKLNEKPIVGNSSYISNKTFLYHGVITISNLNADEISKIINLSENDYKSIKQLPYLSDKELTMLEPSIIKDKIKNSLSLNIYNYLKNLNDIKNKEIRLNKIDNNFKDSIIKNAEIIANNKYKKEEWINNKKIGTPLKTGRGYCLLYEG
ncbi:MAG: lipoate--protein ligase family protein [Candidatus Micrarchaeia archaeon]